MTLVGNLCFLWSDLQENTSKVLHEGGPILHEGDAYIQNGPESIEGYFKSYIILCNNCGKFLMKLFTDVLFLQKLMDLKNLKWKHIVRDV